MKIDCFRKVKNKKLIALRERFDELVPNDTDMPESEQKEIGKELVKEYYDNLIDQYNDLRRSIDPTLNPISPRTEFSIATTTTDDILEMQEVVKEQVDAGTTSLEKIQDIVAKELEDDSQELKDLVAIAYREYTIIETPKEIIEPIIKRVEENLSAVFGGENNVEILPDTESVIEKANELGGSVNYQKSLRDYVNIVLTSIVLSSSLNTDNNKAQASTELTENKKQARDTIEKLVTNYFKENDEEVPADVMERAFKVWDRVGRPDVLPDSTNNDERAYRLGSRSRPRNTIIANITNFDDLVAELSHAAQIFSQAELDIRGNYGTAEYDSIEYNRKGSVEYDAHKLIEPMIAAYILKGRKAAESVKTEEDGNAVDKYYLNKILYMRSPDGAILGFSTDNKIYLNGKYLNPNTPIHEAGHVWLNWSKQNNPRVYQRGLELVTGSRYMEAVKENPFYNQEAQKLPEAEREQYLKGEALATAIGDRGAQFITEAKKTGFKEWLNSLWTSIKNTIGFKGISSTELSNLTLDEFTKRAAADILRQQGDKEKTYREKVRDITRKLKSWQLSYKDKQIVQDVIETDERFFNDKLSREDYLRFQIDLHESQLSMQRIVNDAKEMFGDNYVSELIDIANREQLSLPAKRNLATRLKEDTAKGNKFVYDRVTMWSKGFATETAAAMNFGRSIEETNVLDKVSKEAEEVIGEINKDLKDGEDIVNQSVVEETSDTAYPESQTIESLQNEITELKAQLEAEKKSGNKKSEKPKMKPSEYAERANAANNRLGDDKKSIIEKIKDIINKC